MNKQLTKYLKVCNVLSSTVQSGVRSEHDCTVAILKVLSEPAPALDSRQDRGSIFIDLVKAVDSIDPDILLKQLTVSEAQDSH